MKKVILILPLVLLSCGLAAMTIVNVDSTVHPRIQPITAVETPKQTSPVASEIAQLVNTERVKNGLSPLVEDARLYASAQAKCQDMVKLNEWGHDLSDATNPQTFINKEFGSYKHSSENLTWGWDDSPLVVSKWMNSPSHRAAILNSNYTLVGYAVCSTSTYDNMVVQHFVGE